MIGILNLPLNFVRKLIDALRKLRGFVENYEKLVTLTKIFTKL